jgi:hypothetical protein
VTEGKKTNSIKVWVCDAMFADIALIAAEDDRSVSDWIARLVKKELYGRVHKTIAHGEKKEEGQYGSE